MRGSLRERGVDGAWLSRMGRDKTRRQRQHSRGPRQHEPRAARPRRQRPCGCGWQRGGSWRPHPLQRDRRRVRRAVEEQSTRRHAPGGSAGGWRPRAHTCPLPPNPPRPARPTQAPTAFVARGSAEPAAAQRNGTSRYVAAPRGTHRPPLFLFLFLLLLPRRPSSPRRRAANDDQDSRSVRLPNPSSAPSRRETQARQSRRRACTVPAVQPANLCVFESRYLSFAC